jgi:hypothetical protein
MGTVKRLLIYSIIVNLVALEPNSLRASPVETVITSKRQLEKFGVTFTSSISNKNCLALMKSIKHPIAVEIISKDNMFFVRSAPSGEKSPQMHALSFGFPVHEADNVMVKMRISDEKVIVITGSNIAFDFKRPNPFK